MSTLNTSALLHYILNETASASGLMIIFLKWLTRGVQVNQAINNKLLWNHLTLPGLLSIIKNNQLD